MSLILSSPTFTTVFLFVLVTLGHGFLQISDVFDVNVSLGYVAVLCLAVIVRLGHVAVIVRLGNLDVIVR